MGLKCTHCDGKITKNPTFQVHESRGKILVLDELGTRRYENVLK